MARQLVGDYVALCRDPARDWQQWAAIDRPAVDRKQPGQTPVAELAADYAALCRDPAADWRRWLAIDDRAAPARPKNRARQLVAGYLALCRRPAKDWRQWQEIDQRAASPARTGRSPSAADYAALCRDPAADLAAWLAIDDRCDDRRHYRSPADGPRAGVELAADYAALCRDPAADWSRWTAIDLRGSAAAIIPAQEQQQGSDHYGGRQESDTPQESTADAGRSCFQDRGRLRAGILHEVRKQMDAMGRPAFRDDVPTGSVTGSGHADRLQPLRPGGAAREVLAPIDPAEAIRRRVRRVAEEQQTGAAEAVRQRVRRHGLLRAFGAAGRALLLPFLADRRGPDRDKGRGRSTGGRWRPRPR